MFQTVMEEVSDHMTIWSQKIFSFSENFCDEDRQIEKQAGKKLW